ncbi:MAG: hypothetical protein GX214_02435 [Clostridiales bacterium]|nr:hypothetical protein [Clostridiales bacterium]
MNNNIIQNLGLLKAQSYYGNNNSTQKISGTLIEKDENNIKLDIGRDKSIEIELKEPIEANLGDEVVINRRDIVKSRILNEDIVEESTSAKDGNIKGGSEILRKLNLPVNEDTEAALKALQDHGVDITKENIQNFIKSKLSLDKIIENLDYDTAIRLIKKDVNLEEESLEKIANTVESSKDTKESFSLLKFLGFKKEMTTEEAEKIAKKIYGNKMGKDITDIIKALDKAGIEINKKIIEHVNRIFDKIDNLQNIEDSIVIDAIKNKIDTNIDNLYKLKNNITKNTIPVEENISPSINNLYNSDATSPHTISDRDLELMEDSIVEQLEFIDIETDEKNISLAKDLIKSGLEVSKENMDNVNHVKEAIRELQSTLDYDKLASLIRAGVDIEREDIISLAELVKSDIDLVNTDGGILENSKIENILKAVENLEKIDNQQLIELIKRGVDFKLGKLDFLTSDDSLKKLSLLLQELDEGNANLVKQHVKTIIHLNKLENLNFDTIAHQMNTKLPTTIERLIISHEEMSNVKLEAPQEAVIREHAINHMRKLGLGQNPLDLEGARALITNNLPINEQNITRLHEIYNQMSSIRNELSSHMLRDFMNNNLVIEKMEIGELANIIENKTSEELYNKENIINSQSAEDTESIENKDKVAEKNMDLNNLIQNIQSLKSQRDGILSLMIKNAIPVNLKKVQQMSFFLNNEQQITSKLKDVLDTLKDSKEEKINNLVSKIEQFLEKASVDFKAGKLRGERFYQQLGRFMRELDNMSHLMESSVRENFEKNSEDLRESINLQSQLNRHDGVLQLPIMLQNQLKNFQMYIMNNKRGSRKIDPNNMSILLNFDTNNMGNVNIYTAVNYKNVVMKIGVKNLEDKNYFEDNLKTIEGLLDKIGYELKEMSFRIEEDQDILTMVEEDIHIHQSRNRFLDITI